MADADIQTSFAAGELSPQLYARVDLDKFQVGAALLRNFFVDYRGGASNRAGTEFIDATVRGARVVPFTVSTSAAYVLVFSNELITIYNLGVFVTTVETPYQTADLFTIAYTQSADVLTLVHPNYPPADLSRTSDTAFSYDLISTGPDIDPPVVTTMVAPHSGPYSFGYLVTSVDLNGKEESLPSNPAVKHSEGQNELTNRVVGLSWDAPLDVSSNPQGVSRYNIYKWGPIDAVTLNPATVWGFIGSSQTTTFTDNNIAPDFSKQPPGWGDPFSGGQFQSITVDNPGSGYDGVTGDWPAIPYVPLDITGDGTDAAGYAVIDHATGEIIGVYLTNSGKNYTAATVTANGEGGTGATFKYTFTDIQALNPAATAYLQQRRVFGGSTLKPETLVMSQPGLINNFNTTPVTLADDSIVMSIAAEEVNTIKSFVQVNYGLLTFTTGGSFLINGGTPGAAIDANSPSVQAQVSQGANDLRPLRINYDVIYGQAKGNRIHNLAFAWQKQSYAGGDISTLAAHLFDTFLTVDWAYAEEPFKIVWAVRDDGKLLSLTYVPDQEVYAWCRHDTQGLFKSVCTVPEGNVDAVYFIVERYIPANNPDPTDPSGNWFYYLERMAERQGCCIFDSWFLDCALSLSKPLGASPLYITPGVGDAVTLNIAPGDVFGGVGNANPPVINGIQQYLGNHDVSGNHQKFTIDWDNLLLYVRNTTNIDVFNIQTAAAVMSGVTDTFGFDNGILYGEGWLYGWGSPAGGTINQVDPTTMTLNQTITGISQVGDWIVLPLTGDINLLLTIGWADGKITYYTTDPLLNSGTVYNTAKGRGVLARAARHGVRSNTMHAWILDTTSGNSAFISTNLYDFAVSASTSSFTLKQVITAASLGVGWTHLNTVRFIILDETDLNLIVGLVTQALAAYSSGTTYAAGAMVSSVGHDYLSRISGNIGHTPASSPTQWQDLGVSNGDESRLFKINPTSGATLWSTVNVTNLPAPDLGPEGRYDSYRIRYGRLCFLEPVNNSFHPTNILHDIDTLTGVDVTSSIHGVYFDLQCYNDYYGQILGAGSYDSGTPGAPVPLNGSDPSWGFRWATLGSFPAANPPNIIGQVVQIGCGKILIDAQPTPTSATGTVIEPLEIAIPDDPDGALEPIEVGGWTVTAPVSTLTGLDHLEGKQVWALADGTVVGPLTVAEGGVSLGFSATNVVVGLKYTQQLQTLYLTTEGIQSGSDQGKRKQISGVTVRTDCTKGLKAGTDFAYLTPVPELNEEITDNSLYTGDARVLAFPQWDRPGQTCIEQDLPLPATVLGVIVEVTPGDTGS